MDMKSTWILITDPESHLALWRQVDTSGLELEGPGQEVERPSWDMKGWHHAPARQAAVVNVKQGVLEIGTITPKGERVTKTFEAGDRVVFQDHEPEQPKAGARTGHFSMVGAAGEKQTVHLVPALTLD